MVDDILCDLLEMRFMPSLEAVRFRPAAVDALQAAAEDFIEDLFRSAKLCAEEAKRETVKPRDFHLVRRIRGEQGEI